MALNFMCDVRKEVQLICTKAVDCFWCDARKGLISYANGTS